MPDADARTLTGAGGGPMLRPMLSAWLGGGPAADPFLILIVALALDAAVGDPAWLYRAVPHPVALLGRLIAAGERRLNRADLLPGARLVRGAGLAAALVFGVGLLGALVERGLGALPGGWLVEAVLTGVLLAFRGLYEHVSAVARGLERSLDEGRAAVAHIVGRDPDALDGPGVARAAAESAAENFSDGVLAPAFWFALFGLGGLAAYKAVNTLDSMVGYRGARYEAFGRAAARLDDALNWAPARLAGLAFVAAAALTPGASPARAWRTMRRDAPRHRSPNAGWPEAALAGALGFRLGGPRRYREALVEDAWMGEGRAELTPADLRRALRLTLGAGAVLAGAVALLLAL